MSKMLRYEQIICFKNVSRILLYLSKHFYIKEEVSRSRFGEHFGSSINHPKSVRIHQESLIRSFRIIKAQIIFWKHKKNLKSPNCFAFFWTLLDNVLGRPIRWVYCVNHVGSIVAFGGFWDSRGIQDITRTSAKRCWTD